MSVAAQDGPQPEGPHASYYRARYYDPTIGRFMSEDPLKSAVRLNRYKFVNNSPNILTDPSGLLEQCTFNGTQQITPLNPLITTTPDSGWHFLFSFAEGPVFPFPWPTVTCNWERKITKEESKRRYSSCPGIAKRADRAA